ncbi:MAG: N-acetyltransferase [Proteobacteria bacterium]|nr:N-acetyltransferase [Pseudomonadota bacterium]
MLNSAYNYSFKNDNKDTKENVMELTIHHDSAAKEFVTIIDGQKATLKYSVINATTWDYYSTFVPNALRGRQIGQTLIKYALNYAKSNQLKIIPSCSFVKKWIQAHPDYQSLIAE